MRNHGITRQRISQMAARLRFMPGGSGWAPIVDVASYAAQRRLVRLRQRLRDLGAARTPS
ncbi:MAG: hypothetical protein OXU21_05020 [Chloroflexota bacterium]|nr:hypothetical protein [Chloroflexota bacterium]